MLFIAVKTIFVFAVACEPGKIPALVEISRIILEEGITEKVPVCQPCPPGTYTDEIGSGTCKQCPKYHTTETSGASSRDSCIRRFGVHWNMALFYMCTFSAQPLLLECEKSTSDGHVTVDCQTNRPPVMTVCSFDDGPEHHCMLHMWKKKKIFIYRTSTFVCIGKYPLVLNLGVSSPGSHMVRIIVTDDEDFTAEDVTEYFIESDVITTGENTANLSSAT